MAGHNDLYELHTNDFGSILGASQGGGRKNVN